MTSIYWAKCPTDSIAHEITSKFAEHEKWLSDTGYGAAAQKMFDAYYSLKEGAQDLSISSDGSQAKISVNHFKSLIERSASLATQSKLQFTPRARNSDAASQLQADFARGLLEAYNDDKGMDTVTTNMVKLGLICLDSYIFAPWDDHQGEVIAKGEGLTELRNGDQAFHLLNRFSVATHPSLAETPYYIIKLQRNKYDLAALHPEQADDILSGSVDHNTGLNISYLQTPFNQNRELVSDDIIDMYILLHDRTPSLPKGRYTEIVGTTVLKDIILPYKTLPVVHFTGSEMLCTNSGDSPGVSLAPLQSAIDQIYSSNVSNNLHYNKQSIWSPTDLDIKPLSEGFQLIISAQKPEAVQLTNSSPESYKMIQGLEQQMQLLSGVNATTRGQPEASLKSGNSLAMMLSVAVMSVNDIQKNWVKAVGELGTIVIHNLQTFATEPRLAYIGGVSKKAFVKEFKNSDIDQIDRITVEAGNPLLSNLGGRYELVQQMMQYGSVKDPSKMIEFLRTGQTDSLTEDQFKDSILIRSENEAIRKGIKVQAAIFDLHDRHILEHKQLSNDPDIRSNPSIMKSLLDHIMEHIKLRKTMDPDLAAIIGLQPLPSQQQMPIPDEQPNPQIMNQSLPSLPGSAPPVAQQAYSEATQSLPDMNEPEELM